MMYTELRKVLGEEVADTMMEYMPPIGWSDVARKSDIDRLEQRFSHVDQRFETIDKRFEQIDKRFEQIDKRFAGLVGGLWALWDNYCNRLRRSLYAHRLKALAASDSVGRRRSVD